MKVDVSTKILGLDGKPVVINGQDLTVKDASIMIVATPYEDDLKQPAAIHLKRYKLAAKLYAATKECELETEEATLIKEMSPRPGFGPVIIGRLHELLK